jgi:hypothetical protein
MGLNSVKDINTNYGSGKVGYTNGGKPVVIRPGSSEVSGGFPTLEIKISGSNKYKIRYK